ncbi:MAG: hypothetical protein WC969_15085 [Elusimicrobiota bacterium]|jgi:hypothetical protein
MIKAAKITLLTLALLLIGWLGLVICDQEAAFRVPLEYIKFQLLKSRISTVDVPAGVDSYQYKVQLVFAEAFKPDVELRALITGGTMETVVFLNSSGEAVTLVAADPSIWDHESREFALERGGHGDGTGQLLSSWMSMKDYDNVPLRLEDYKVSRKSRQLPAGLKEKLMKVWVDALIHAKRDQHRIGLDGGTFDYFVQTSARGALRGKIWSPDEGTIPYALLPITNTLIEYLFRGISEEKIEEAINNYWTLAAKRTPESLELEWLGLDAHGFPLRAN